VFFSYKKTGLPQNCTNSIFSDNAYFSSAALLHSSSYFSIIAGIILSTAVSKKEKVMRD